MKKKTALIWQILFFSMLVLPTLLFFLFFRGKEPATYENRSPVDKPNLTLENYRNIPSEITAYYNDNLPFRSSMVSLYSYGIYKTFHETALPYVIAGKDNWLFYNRPHDGDNIMDYKGLCNFSEEHLIQICGQLQQVQEELAKNGCQFVLFIAPDKDHVYSEYMPDYIQGPGNSRAYALTNYLYEHAPEITVIYPLGELLMAKEENPEEYLYYHYDTHWNSMGAYLASRQLLFAVGLEPSSKYEMEITETNESEYDLADLQAIRNFLKDDVGYEIKDPALKPAQLVADNGGGYFVMEATDENADPRHLYIYRDSFSDQLAPFLLPRFQKTTMVQRNQVESVPPMEDDYPDIFVYEISERYLDQLLSFRISQ